MTDETSQQLPKPDPTLRELDFLVGTWSMKGHLVGSDEEKIAGETTYEWLPGGFFLRQHVRIDFAGLFQIDSEEFIGHDPVTGKFKSYVYSNLAPEPLPYYWDVKDGSVTITVSYGPLDATYKGELGEDGDTFSGGWRPNPGADETVNFPYDIGGTRIEHSHEFTRGLYGWITHTELASNDPAATREWCAEALGWTFQPAFPTPGGDYHLFSYSEAGGGGIRQTAPGEAPGSTPTVHVEDAQVAYDAALAAGAESVNPPTKVMEGVCTAMVRAPGGALIGFSGPTD